MEKQFPNDIEAEMGVLGSLIIDPDAYDQVADLIGAQDFYRDEHRTIYSVIVALNSQRIGADVITICDEIERRGQDEEVRPAYITELINQVPTSGNVVFYAGIVARCALNRRLIHAAGQIAAAAYAEQDDALEQADKLLFDVSTHRRAQHLSIDCDMVDGALQEIDQVHRREKMLVGVPTGFTDVDHYLGGLQRSDLIILAARPGMGKSSWMLSAAYNAVYEHNHRVLIASLEMSERQLIQRLLSYETHIDLYRLRNGYIEDDEWEKLYAARERFQSGRLAIDDTGGMKVSALRSTARRMAATSGLDLIIVDYLQLMKTDTGNKNNREQEIAEITRELKELAKELSVPVVALAQLSRKVEERGNKTPMLSDLRESGEIENSADVVLFIYREGYYDPDTQRPDVADIILAKHRNGPVGEVSLRWVGKETRFENLEVM